MSLQLSIKELIVSNQTGYIKLNLTLSEMINYLGQPEYINRVDKFSGLISIGYENDYFTFNKDELLIIYIIKFRDLNEYPMYNNNSNFVDYLECKSMTRKEWLTFFKKNGFKLKIMIKFKDKYEYFTTYSASKDGEYIEFSLCHNTDRVQHLSCTYSGCVI